MASSYSTSLGIEKMATGDQSGTWGDTSNHNWDIIDRISAYTAVALSDASTATLTVREASPESGTENLQNGMYRVVKFTGSLSQACTVTIAPNTSKMFFIVINATTDAGSSGPYSLAFTQGSGANVTVQNGNNAVIYCDGAGGGAVVTDALSDLQIGNDLSLVSDSAVLNMGADNDITITHVADVGLKLKQAGATGDGSPFVLTLQTGELDIAAADVLGQIDFQAPDETTGSDAILVAAGISAISEGDFSSSSNATKLSFKTASSAAAAETMSLSSGGNLTIAGDLTISGSALSVGNGGTGASSLTDGGVLLGSGTGAVTAMAVLADSEMIVGDGTTDPVAESGATLRTSIGVAIGSDVQAHGAVLDDFNTLDAASSDGEMIVATGAGVFAYESGATLRTSVGVGTSSVPDFDGLLLKGNKFQSFLLMFQNRSGAINHQIISDQGTYGASDFDDKVSGATNSFNVTPSVDSSTAFTAGVGISATNAHQIFFDTAAMTDAQLFVMGKVEYNNTGNEYVTRMGTSSSNVNGTTRRRPDIQFLDFDGGNNVAINTTNIALNKILTVRVFILIP